MSTNVKREETGDRFEPLNLALRWIIVAGLTFYYLDEVAAGQRGYLLAIIPVVGYTAFVQLLSTVRKVSSWFRGIDMIVNLVLFTFVIYLTGADSSELYMIYLLLIAAIAFWRQDLRSTLVYSMVCVLSYLGVIVVEAVRIGLSVPSELLLLRFLVILLMGSFLGTLAERTRRRREALAEALEATDEELARIREFSRTVGEAATIDEIVAVAAKALSRALDCEWVVIMLLDPRTDSVVVHDGSISPPEAPKPYAYPLRVIQDGLVPLVTNEPSTLPGEMGELALRLGVENLLSVPIRIAGKLFGVVHCANKGPGFLPEDVRFVRTLTPQLAASIQSSEQYERVQRELAQSEKLAAVGRLVAGIAHELNNPLATVCAYAEHLVGTVEDESLKRDLEKIDRAAWRCRRAVKGLLDFARSQPPVKTNVHMAEIVEEALRFVSDRLSQHSVRVETDFAEGLPAVCVDPYQLGEVCSNIINNAIDAMANSERERLLTIRTSLNDDKVRLEISDTGTGIPESLIDQVFDPFFSTKDHGKGTGLGLSICYGIVRRHDGEIRAESEPGTGTTMTVDLPSTGEEIATARAEAAAVHFDLSGLRLLVAEDEEDLRELLTRVLRSEGCAVDTAETGAAAMRLLDVNTYDLVLADIKMPTATGNTLYQYVCERFPHLKGRIVFITGDTASLDTAVFLEETGNPWIGKPFQLGEIKAAIETCLSETTGDSTGRDGQDAS